VRGFAAACAIAVLGVGSGAGAAGWRIGFEWNENWPWSPPWSDPSHGALLEKLADVAPGGAINVNGGFTWVGLQPFVGSPLDFSHADEVVTLFQNHGFELVWYLTSDARWAWVDPGAPVPIGASMAPAPEHEAAWQALVRGAVERYDGDGNGDMPGLQKPVRFFVMPGEVRFGITGQGDGEARPFWADTISALLRLHRLTYQAVREADPTGATLVVGSGALLWDLYADFPDYPAFDPDVDAPTVAARLAGSNYRGSDYRFGWSEMRELLASFGDDGDGVECDLVGWHPHFSWRVIDQELAWIRSLADGKPVFVDDMWANLFTVGYSFFEIVGYAQFNATPFPSRAWVERLWGDFPNDLFPGIDPYGVLFDKLEANDAAAHAWYRRKGAHSLVKSFASAFGEGAERAMFSGSNDVVFLGQRAWQLGWINLLGTLAEGYPTRPQTFALRALADQLATFTAASRLAVGTDPRTRAYRFARPGGDLIVAWSETGPVPPGLDYDVPNGEAVVLPVTTPEVRLLVLPDEDGETHPTTATVAAPGGLLPVQLGYRPLLVAELPPELFADGFESADVCAWSAATGAPACATAMAFDGSARIARRPSG
jgi:hypothetical protein